MHPIGVKVNPTLPSSVKYFLLLRTLYIYKITGTNRIVNETKNLEIFFLLN